MLLNVCSVSDYEPAVVMWEGERKVERVRRTKITVLNLEKLVENLLSSSKSFTSCNWQNRYGAVCPE